MNDLNRRDFLKVTGTAAAVLLCPVNAAQCLAGSITLRDGTVLRGAVEPLEGGLFRLDDGLRKITFHSKRVALTDINDTAPPFRPFRVPQQLSGRSQTEQIDNLIQVVNVTPFDEFGRRTFTTRDPLRGDIDLPQGIVEVRPEYVRVQCLKYLWESSVATNTIPPATIDAVLRRSVDRKKVDDRLRLARFFLAMEWIAQTEKELAAIEQEFPEVADQVREAREVLKAMRARRQLDELKLRRRAGQHQFAYRYLREFPPEGAPGEVLTEVRDLVKEYETVIERVQEVRRHIEKLLGEVKDAEVKGKLLGPLQEVAAALEIDNVDRLDNFLTTVGKEELAAEDRLALAVSGWLVGSPSAESKVDRALRLWDARTQIQQYLREPSESRRQRLLADLRRQEATSVELAARIIEHLPPVVATNGLEPGEPVRLNVAGAGEHGIAYWVLLPMEYNPNRRYPVIVTLHGASTTPEQQIGWWSAPPVFQASRQGYIVVAPEYLDNPQNGFQFNGSSHDAVLYSLIDVRRRFSVDSDRVFLTGHHAGGDAAWDMGLAHPDLFAGVIPISGSPKYFAEYYWQNGENASFYVIEGEKNGKGPVTNKRVLDHMMANGHDVLYVEFQGRGNENFIDEQLRVFDWMGRKTRRKFPLSFTCRSARTFDNEFFWLSVGSFVKEVLMDPPPVFDHKKMKPATLVGKLVGTANSIQLDLRGAKSADLWLSPDMLDLQQAVTVRVNGVVKQRKPVPFDLEVLLEDFRLRADRQKLFYAKLSIPRL